MTKIADKIVTSIINFIYQFIYKSITNLPLIKLYQPVYGADTNKKLTRVCIDRWEAVQCHLPKKKGSVLDIGCNIGYFSFKFSEEGHFSYGVEHHRKNILICSAIKHCTQVTNVSFLRHSVDIDFLEKMPKYETIVNLSVFHHWVKQYGQERAQKMMAIISDKCDCLIFETGQSNETGSQWPQILSFMGEDPEAWITDFLVQIGFKNVTNLGTFSTDLTQTKRTLYIAKK